MKTIVEFGIIGGALCDNFICTSIEQGNELANKLCYIFGRELSDEKPKIEPLKVGGSTKRETWKNATHFVAVSLLDGSQTGPAASKLWREE